MRSFKSLALAFLLGNATNAFMQNQPVFSVQKQNPATSTELYIIGPMIRKMREEKAKKNMPMASDEERSGEAPGLRVGSGAWKWPPVWPYGNDEFVRKDEIVDDKPSGNPLNGMMGMPPAAADEEEKEVDVLDILNYWGSEKADVRTEVDVEASLSLKKHYSFYLKDGMEVLELGAAEESYLPDNLKLSRHVGVGASKALMEQNPALTESLVVNLNDVTEEVGVNSDELAGLGSFDVILMANTIDFLTSPREVFRSSWQYLKPGGTMIVPFVNREAYTDKFGKAQVNMWTTLNDDQHMWICGSFFQFSAGDGWTNLKGFDISPESSKKAEGIQGLLDQNKGMSMFVVQATKATQDHEIDALDPEKSFKSRMWVVPTLEERDKKLLAPRLTRSYNALKTQEDKDALAKNVESLPTIYESLIKMDQFAFTFNMQAQLATNLVTDSSFEGNDEQVAALKMGLGLRTPSKDFWEIIGQRTINMDPEDKINLLSHLVPRFGSDDAAQEEALQSFVTGMEPTFEVIKSKCGDMSSADVQLLGTELLASEILIPGRSTKEEFAVWLGALSESEMKEILDKRKSYQKQANADMKQMQEEREEENKRIEAAREKMIEQQQKAREERSMVFNPATGKMEEYDGQKK